MKTFIPKVGLCLFSILLASLANAGIPPVSVVVSDAGGKAAFKGTTKSDGGFATEKLPPGNYVVQFNSRNSALKGGQYSIIVAAGKKKVVANSLSGERFLGGGVAMKIDVGAGLGIVGHVSAGPLPTDTAQKDAVKNAQDRGQDQHQNGYRPSMSNVQDKMSRPGGY
jgi:hypothetical protein